MIILFYSNECNFCSKLLEYLKKNDLEKYFKMMNIDAMRSIPTNITIVPTIIDDTIEAPLEGKKAFEYIINQKYFNHPTNNIDFWINSGVPKPEIQEDKKAIDRHNFSFASIDLDIKETQPVQKVIQKAPQQIAVKDRKTLALLKLRRK
jgi:glutaredoxin